MAERSILVKVRGQINDLAAAMSGGGRAVKGFGDAVAQANAKAAQGGVRAAAAEKAATAAAKLRAQVRAQAADEEVRANERVRISAEKYGKTTATVLQHADAVGTVTRGIGAAGLVAAAGVGVAVSRFADFDQQMSAVAATGADARASMADLRQASLDAGAATKFSATEAAGGVEALLKAGVSASDVLGGGLSGALSLAAAGNQSVADSAETAASAMNQFGLAGKDVPHIADLLAQAAGTAQGEVSDMAQALNQSGLIAHTFGLSIEETTQSLALFAKNGLLGSDAGTSFKTMLTSLYAPAGSGAEALTKLGVSAYDSVGNIKPIGAVLDDLKGRLSTLSEEGRNRALRDIFGSDAIRAGTLLLKDGSAGLREMADEFGNFGTAADVARIKMDNLAGDIEQLRGSLDTALIGAGSGGNAALRAGTQAITEQVNAFNRLPAAGQKAALIGTAIAAGSALGVAGLAKLVTGAAAARAALVSLNLTGAALIARMGPLAAAIALAVGTTAALKGAGSLINRYFEDTASTVDEAATAVSTGGQAINDFFAFSTRGDITVGTQQVDGLGEAFDRLAKRNGITKFNDFLTQSVTALTGVKGAADIAADRFSQMDTVLAQMKPADAAAGFAEITRTLTAQGASADEILGLFPQLRAEYDRQARSLDVTTLSAQELADWMGGKVPPAITAAAKAARTAGQDIGNIPGVTQAATQSLADLVKAAADTSNSFLAMSNSRLAMEAAIDALADATSKITKKQRESGAAFDETTKFGREHIALLNQLAASTSATASAMANQGESVDHVAASYARGRAKFIAAAVAMGKTKEEAVKLADASISIPAEIRTQFVFSGAKVSAKEARDLNKELKGIPKEQRARIVTIAETQGAKAARAAMAQVKDKQVIARSKGDLKGAKQVDAAMKALKDRLNWARTRGDKRGAAQIEAAMKALKDRTVWARVKGDPSGAWEVRDALATVHGKVVNVTIRRNTINSGDEEGSTGGLFIGGGFSMRAVRRSNGGAVWGEGSATSDSIPAMLSNGEFVHREKAVSYYGAGVMDALNRMVIPKDAFTPYGFKDGGKAGGGWPTFAAGGRVDVALIMRLLAAATNFPGDVRSADARENTDQAALRRRNRILAEAQADLKHAHGKRQVAAAHKELEKAQDAQKKASDRAKESTDKLKDAQKAFADAARQSSDTLATPYRSQSHDVADILGSMREGARDLATFQKQILALRNQGLNETSIQQLIGQGALVGSEIAGQIVGNKGIVASLNSANAALQKAADSLGYTANNAKGRHATGGMMTGPGTGTSDSIITRVSNGEWLTPADKTQANLPLLRAITYGTPLPRQYAGAAGSRSGDYHRHDHYHAGDVSMQGVYGDPDVWLRKVTQRRRDAYTMAGLSRGV